MAALPPAPKPLTRVEVKELMTVQWDGYIKLCDFPVHLLVISTQHRSDAPPAALFADKRRFVGQRGEYYFIVAYFDRTYDSKEYFLIAHETVQEINNPLDNQSSIWRIPLYLCQMEAEFNRKTAFTHYQDKVYKIPAHFPFYIDPANPNKPSLEGAFKLRLELYKWFAKDAAFQDAHPLSAVALGFARDSPNVKDSDQISYFLLAKHLKARDYMRWVKGEAALMQHKIYLRPKLGNRVCAMTLAPHLGVEMAISKLHKFHQLNRIRMTDVDWSFLDDADAIALVDKFFADLKADEAGDDPPEEPGIAKLLLDKKVMTSKITPKQQIFLGDIRRCAPQCLSRLLKMALGTDAQRAGMNDLQRYHMNRILLEHRVDVEDIEDIVRPLSLSAFNNEKPERWNEVKAGIKKASIDAYIEQHRDNEEENKLHIKCEDMMTYALCPHLVQSLPVKPFSKSLALRKQRFIDAKKACHLDMELKREVEKRSAVRRNSLNWIDTPWAFTRVAMIGNAGGVDKKAAKRKGAGASAGEIAIEEDDPSIEDEAEDVGKRQRT